MARAMRPFSVLERMDGDIPKMRHRRFQDGVEDRYAQTRREMRPFPSPDARRAVLREMHRFMSFRPGDHF